MPSTARWSPYCLDEPLDDDVVGPGPGAAAPRAADRRSGARRRARPPVRTSMTVLRARPDRRVSRAMRRQTAAVHERPVRRAEVLHREPRPGGGEGGVPAGDLGVLVEDHVGRARDRARRTTWPPTKHLLTGQLALDEVEHRHRGDLRIRVTWRAGGTGAAGAGGGGAAAEAGGGGGGAAAEAASGGGGGGGGAGMRTSIVVVPSWIRSPAWSWREPVTRSPFTKVPLVEPRSSTVMPPSEGVKEACRVETSESASTRSAPGSRPTIIVAVTGNSRPASGPSTIARVGPGTARS